MNAAGDGDGPPEPPPPPTAIEDALQQRPDGSLWLRVRVAPRASRTKLLGLHDGAIKIALTAPPVDGAANAALVAFVAKTLGIAKRAVSLVAGDTSRQKVLCLEGICRPDAERALRERMPPAPP